MRWVSALHHQLRRRNGNKATAKFRQDYRANGIAISSRKTLDLVKVGNNWKIVREAVGG